MSSKTRSHLTFSFQGQLKNTTLTLRILVELRLAFGEGLIWKSEFPLRGKMCSFSVKTVCEGQTEKQCQSHI